MVEGGGSHSDRGMKREIEEEGEQQRGGREMEREREIVREM